MTPEKRKELLLHEANNPDSRYICNRFLEPTNIAFLLNNPQDNWEIYTPPKVKVEHGNSEPFKAENALDAARWRQFRGMVSAKSVAKGDPAVFVIPKIDNILGANLLKGSVAEHFDAAMDANILMGNK